jgi:hypothetical protein
MTHKERNKLIQEIQSALQQQPAAEGKPWIMESPDGGKTISKHKFGDKEKFYLSNVNGKWYNYEDALQAVRQQDHEAELREQHPGLKESWEIYRTMLAIVDPNIGRDKADKA